jgi:hypothetical protein
MQKCRKFIRYLKTRKPLTRKGFVYLLLLMVIGDYLPIQNFKTLTSKGFQGRGTNGVQE